MLCEDAAVVNGVLPEPLVLAIQQEHHWHGRSEILVNEDSRQGDGGIEVILDAHLLNQLLYNHIISLSNHVHGKRFI